MEYQFEKSVAPFLRWTGSKRWFTKNHIEDFLPKTFGNYHEPFLGAGAVFFYLRNKISAGTEYFLSDSNDDLTNSYIQLRDNPIDIIDRLKKFKNTKEEYYQVRSLNMDCVLERAARFIYLNRTSFNGS